MLKFKQRRYTKMHVLNGCVIVNTSQTEGVFLSTKCGELRTKKENRRFEVYNNFSETIYCTLIMKDYPEREEIKPGNCKEVVIHPDINELRLSFGVPSEEPKYSFTSALGEGYGGNEGIIVLFYTVNSTTVKVNSLV
jgi:hypothetical protein